MKRLTIFALCVFAAASFARKSDPNPIVDVSQGVFSPSQALYVQHRHRANGVTQIWVVYASAPAVQEVLYAYNRSAEVLFSDDEGWLVINDYAGSDLTEVHVFRRKGGVHYQEVEDISSRAWAYVAEQVGLRERPLLYHNYAEVLRWVDDRTVLVSLHGHSDSDHYVTQWLCLYDVEKKVFSSDLNKFNRAEYKYPGDIKGATESPAPIPPSTRPAAVPH